MSIFSPRTLPSEVILYITDRLTSLRDLSALASTNHAFDALLSPVLYRHGMRLDSELFLRMCGQGGSRTGTVARLLAAGADPSIQHLSANSRRFTGIVGHGTLNTPGHFDSSLRYNGRTQHCSDLEDPDLAQAGWELGSRDDAICVRSCTPEELQQAIVDASHDAEKWHVSWSAIHVAAVRGHVGVLKLLVEHQQDLINSLAPGYGKVGKYEPSLRRRRKFIHLDEGAMDRLLIWGTWPQLNVWSLHTPLRAALCARQDDAARFLIDNGANLKFEHPENARCYEHALHMAARYGCVDVIRYLCGQQNLADVNVRDSDGWTPLCQAIVSPLRNIDTITSLLTHGADVNAELPENDGMTHLHLACWRRDWHRALQLLHAGADVHAIWTPNPATLPENYGSHGPWRAIDLVCMNTFKKAPEPSRTELLRRLVQEHGADVGVCPGAEHSALAIAATNPGNADEFEIGAVEMLTALMDAGVYFHKDKSVIEKAFTVPTGLHVNAQPLTPKTTMEVVTWLARHGARVNAQSNEGVFAGILKASEYVVERKLKEPHLLDKFTEMITMLIKRGGMDPNITSLEHDVAKERPCSLFQAVLKVPDVQLHQIMSKIMEEVGAQPAGLLDALREFGEMSPGMQVGEARAFEKREMSEERQQEEKATERLARVDGVLDDSDDDKAAHRHGEVAGSGNDSDALIGHSDQENEAMSLIIGTENGRDERPG